MPNAAAKRACEELIVRLTHAQDHNRAQAAAALFVTDGTWIRSGVSHQGHEAIVRSFDRAGQTVVIRHMVSSTLIDIIDDTHATGVTYYLAFANRDDVAADSVRRLRSPASLGEWHDRFERTPQGWRFTHRTGVRIFES
jgi:hypothetical protein